MLEIVIPNDLLRLGELAELLGVSKWQARQLATGESFPAGYQLIEDGQLKWSRAEVVAWANDPARRQRPRRQIKPQELVPGRKRADAVVAA
jgi:predicted DNA-binding transcriptional regulator AlpA